LSLAVINMAGKGNADKANAAKLGTFSGVFVPTTLYTFSILMFLRFGFILGQTGVIGFMGKSLMVVDNG
jgi:hypothetical protein